MPVSVTSEISRLENKDGQRCHDKELALKVSAMSKITLASSAEVWLISLPGEPFNHFINLANFSSKNSLLPTCISEMKIA
jgi:hypothetical protein